MAASKRGKQSGKGSPKKFPVRSLKEIRLGDIVKADGTVGGSVWVIRGAQTLLLSKSRPILKGDKIEVTKAISKRPRPLEAAPTSVEVVAVYDDGAGGEIMEPFAIWDAGYDGVVVDMEVVSDVDEYSTGDGYTVSADDGTDFGITG